MTVPPDSPFSIATVSWRERCEDLLAVRTEVFVREQGVPEEIEVDEWDPKSVHALARDGTGTPIGTARLLPVGRIGRVAVIRSWRGRGVGLALMNGLIESATEAGHAELVLHAQTWTTGFYERIGFVAEGPVFDEAGIPHRTMRLLLRPGCGSA